MILRKNTKSHTGINIVCSQLFGIHLLKMLKIPFKSMSSISRILAPDKQLLKPTVKVEKSKFVRKSSAAESQENVCLVNMQ